MKFHAKVEDHDRGWAAVFKRAKDIKNGRVKVGVLAEGKGAEKHDDESGLTVAEIAVANHFGTDMIPPRPFLSMAFDQQRDALARMGARLLVEVMFGSGHDEITVTEHEHGFKMTAERALGILGAKLAAEAKKVISIGTQLQPNAPSTMLQKAAKGRTRRLFFKRGKDGEPDQRRMANSLGQALAQVGALAAVRPLVDTGRLLNAITWALDKDSK